MALNPLILAVETSGRLGSVAIAFGGRIMAETAFTGEMRHSAEIFPAICSLLKSLGRSPKQIEHIYLSVGPGSFTGLRIAVSIAKIMHLANSTKIVAVDTLDVIAANTDDYTKQEKADIGQIAVILDAKRGQFYIAGYKFTKEGILKKIFSDSLMTAPQFLERFSGKAELVWLLGEGLVFYEDKFRAEGLCFLDERYWYPQAQKVHTLGWELACAGQFDNPLLLQPKYLRKPQVTEKRES
jgi:tRNA threonylcarbamoyladenosine biosynthesis protein TsaB